MDDEAPTAGPVRGGAKVRRSRVIDSMPLHYGWVILAVGTFGMIMTTPGQTLGVSVFLDRIIDELGASRSEVSLMYTLATLAGAATLPFIGRFIDRRGPRIAVVLVSAAFALACVAMGFVTGLVTLALGFLAIRALGQGALSLASVHVINIWFVRRRGMAVGLMGAGVAAATAFAPLGIEALVSAVGWRSAYMLLGGIVALTILPLGALLFRGHPERYGVRPDGQTVKPRADEPAEAAYTAGEARRTVTFWVFLAGDFWVSGLGTGLVFHHFSILAEGGLDRFAAAAVFVPLSLVAAGANLASGFLLDRVSPRLLLSVSLFFLATALVMAVRVTGPEGVIAYGAVLGLATGIRAAVAASSYAHYFGRAHIGAIKGMASTGSVAASSVGPLLFAFGMERLGGYGTVLAVSALFPLAQALVLPFLRLQRADGGVR
jgi:MFS transporter, OFA family, oxalate/formate antiporter